MRMQEFKEGKIAVYAETVEEAYRFLAACEKERLRWYAGQKATEFNPGENVEIVYGFCDCHGLSWTNSGRGWHAQHPDPDRPYKSVTVAEFFGKRERVTVYRTDDGRVECVHSVDGNEVGKASVTRYYKDTDDFLTAAKFAIRKLPSPFNSKGEPNYKVGQMVRMRKGYSHPKAFVGKITEVEPCNGMTYRVREPNGWELWQYDREVIGLAE